MAFLTLLPVIFEPINKMWHTGDYMAFPMRYGYMTTLMMLTFAAVKLSHTRSEDYAEKSKKGILPEYLRRVLYFSDLRYGITTDLRMGWIHMFRLCGEALSRSVC